jgi:hypothetical protein
MSRLETELKSVASRLSLQTKDESAHVSKQSSEAENIRRKNKKKRE